jgi:putative hydrolase of the HAD superfamily
VALVALFGLLGVGCQAGLSVDVEIGDDGAGVVQAELVLDAEASATLADLGADASLPLTDLAQAGWRIGPPAVDDDGNTVITAEKDFGSATQFGEVMDELSGGRGLFDGFELQVEQSFGRIDYRLDGRIDPSEGLSAFGDPELVTALGRSLEAIASSPRYDVALEDLTVGLVVTLPGQFQEEGSNGATVTDVGEPAPLNAAPVAAPEVVTRQWAGDLAGQPLDVALRSTRRSISAQVLRGVAVVAAVLAALALFAQVLRSVSGLRRSRSKPVKARPADARGRPAVDPVTTGPVPEPPEEEQPVGFRVVALDGMGVLYREGDDIRSLLIPFAREHGSAATDEEIIDKVRLLSLGRTTPTDFWRSIGLDTDPDELDRAYLAKHQLTTGVVRYLRALREEGVRAACLTNDSAAWATKLRAGHSLDGLIDPWVVSGSVGVRKPDPPIYEVLRRVTGEAPSNILIIDDDLDNLDVARDLGFGTRWFVPADAAAPARADTRGHEVLRGFEGFSPVDTIDVAPDVVAEAEVETEA